MAYTKPGSPFLFDETTNDIVGFKDRDTSEVLLSSVSGGGNPATTMRNVGTRVWALGTAVNANMSAINGGINAAAQVMTAGCAMEVEGPFDAVRVILLGVAATTQTVNNVKCAAIADMSTTAGRKNDIGFASPVACLFNGSASVVIPAGTITNPSLVVSDWTAISSIPRTDGGTRPAIGIRAAYLADANGSTCQISYWNRSGADWSGAGQFVPITSSVVGDQTSGNYASSFESTNCPIFGVQYRSKLGVMSTLWVGDSITAGSVLTAGLRRAFPVKVCQGLSSATRPIEFAVAGFPGQAIATWRTWVLGAYAGATGGTTGIKSGATNLDVLSPTHVFISGWSVNNCTLATITDAQINTIRQDVVRLISEAKLIDAVPCLWNGIPKSTGTTGVPFYGATDSKRTDANLDQLSWGFYASNFGAVVGDSAAPQAFQSTSTGYPANLTSDGTHPSDAGDAALSTSAAVFVATVAESYFGR